MEVVMLEEQSTLTNKHKKGSNTFVSEQNLSFQVSTFHNKHTDHTDVESKRASCPKNRRHVLDTSRLRSTHRKRWETVFG